MVLMFAVKTNFWISGQITVQAAQNAMQFWHGAFKNGEALLMAVCIMPESFDRLAKKGDGQSTWWIPIVAAASKKFLLGTQVDCVCSHAAFTLRLG